MPFERKLAMALLARNWGQPFGLVNKASDGPIAFRRVHFVAHLISPGSAGLPNMRQKPAGKTG
jgi:hypothetical protein